MERANDCTINTPPGVITARQIESGSSSGLASTSSTAVVPKSTTTPATVGSKGENSNAVDKRHNSHTPAWLNISLDAALGCRANVFLLHKTTTGSGGKKSVIEHRQIYIHPQAVPTICRYRTTISFKVIK